MDNYDEDLSENPFFQAFLQSFPDLFSQCVRENWLICIPRKDSLPKYTFTIEDISHHILKPFEPKIVENDNNVENKDGGTQNSKVFPEKSFWNYITLAKIKIEYSGTNLILENETTTLSGDATINEAAIPVSNQIRKEILFEETFYSCDKQKYKVLCIASPLNSKMDRIQELNGTESVLGLWNLTSLRDCIDFLWMKGGQKLLESYDAHIKLFLHNHRGLENLPLLVQKDVVYTLFLKCLQLTANNNESENSSVTDFLMQRFQLATETYILNGIYRVLISAITSSVTAEDANVNKVMRNLSELHPQDLDIPEMHWENMGRARQELSRLCSYTSPLGKLTCLKRMLRYLRSQPSLKYEDCGDRILSTDDLIPIWVYLTVKNPLGNWQAQLEFLRHFRFSEKNEKDNENVFFIVTLEAALEHLKTGRVMGFTQTETEDGIPCDLGEAWLHALHESAMEEDTSPLGELFDVIRLGNCARLEELIEEYEDERRLHYQLEPEEVTIDHSQFCHPLCNCQHCLNLVRPLNDESHMDPAVRLKTDVDGLSLLHVACIYGRPKIVDYLINRASPLEVHDSHGMTPLHFAASRGHQNALLLLVHSGALLNSTNQSGNTAMHLASQNGHEGCVKALIYYAEHSRQYLNMSARNCYGDTPLHFASRWGFQGIVQILVEHGAAITLANIRHTTPLDCAHDIHILRILQKSMRRRSFLQSDHGDFINIEMMHKENETGTYMLIKEPIENDKNEAEDEGTELLNTGRRKSTTSSVQNQTVSPGNSQAASQSPSQNTSRAASRRSSVALSIAPPDMSSRRSSLSVATNPHVGIGSNSRRNSLNTSGLPILPVISNAVIGRRNSLTVPDADVNGPGLSVRRRRHSFATGNPPVLNSVGQKGNSRRSSVTGIPSFTLTAAVPASTRSRKTSVNYLPSMGISDLDSGIPEESFAILISDSFDASDPNFVHNSEIIMDPTEPEHLRTISAESLGFQELDSAEDAVNSALESKDRDIRKLFTSIALGDVPLALFYMGLPAEEISNPDNSNVKIKIKEACHPLCRCRRCIANDAGLGLGINVKNLEGYTPLHLAVQYELETLVKILVRYGALVNMQSSFDKKTALDFAKERDVTHIIEVLESSGAMSSTSFSPEIIVVPAEFIND